MMRMKKIKRFIRHAQIVVLDLLYRGRPYREFYTAVMRLGARQDPRQAIGGLWDEIGLLQFRFLQRQGLQPHHSLLDIGCGSLRGGLHFIRYLDYGNYTGIDISPEILAAAGDNLNDLKLGNKNARLVRVNDLCFSELEGKKFDFLLAQSVFTHMPAEDVEECLQHISNVMHPQSSLYATIHESVSYKKRDLKNFTYTLSWFEECCSRYGLVCKREPAYRHPRGQVMLRIAFSAAVLHPSGGEIDKE